MSDIGRNEVKCVTALDEDSNLKYTITSSKDQSWYYIYDKDYKKLGKAKNPNELERKFFSK